jgi:hypothetical protein
MGMAKLKLKTAKKRLGGVKPGREKKGDAMARRQAFEKKHGDRKERHEGQRDNWNF